MKVSSEQTLRFDMDALGQTQSWSVDHRGLEYKGEIIVAEKVDAARGLPLPEGISD